MKKGIFSLFAFTLLFTMGGWAQNTNGNTKVNNTAPPANQSPTTGAYGKTYGDQDQTKVLKRLDDSATDLNRIVNAPDSGVPQTVLSKAKCVAIVPTLAKGGFIFGAEYGRGVATCRLPNGRWSGPAFFTLTGGSWGAQIGGEAVDLVMLFMNDEGANKLMQAKWKIGGDVGIAAGPWGREGSASTDWKANTGILTYSKAKGAFVGATLNGANVHVDENAMRALYGPNYPNFRAVLTGKTRVPPAANRFLASVRQDFHEASANK